MTDTAPLAGVTVVAMEPVPGLGEHTVAVLGELRLTTEELARLRADGVIGPAYGG